MSYELIVLLIIQSEHKIKTITKELIQTKAYLLSRKLQKDFGFINLVYNVYSPKIEDAIDYLYLQEYIINGYLPRPFRAYLKISISGDNYIDNLSKSTDERLIQHYTLILETINHSAIFESRSRLAQVVILDMISKKIGGLQDTQYLINSMRILGWYPTTKEFISIYNQLKRLRLPYVEKPKILLG